MVVVVAAVVVCSEGKAKLVRHEASEGKMVVVFMYIMCVCVCPSYYHCY